MGKKKRIENTYVQILISQGNKGLIKNSCPIRNMERKYTRDRSRRTLKMLSEHAEMGLGKPKPMWS